MSAGALAGKRVASYMILPGIIPEVKNLLKSNFGYLAFLIAMIYQMVRILPKNHPYTRPANIGRFTIRQVIAIAANHVQFNRKNIDQIVVFGVILLGMVLIVLQILSLLFFLFSGQAFAQITIDTSGIFATPAPDTDIAFIMIREVFGIPDLFGPVEETGLHRGLQTLVLFYNYAILFVAVLIFLYYIITVIGETATTGVPFGQRFSHIYAPFRLVIAIGLLVPLGNGFNGAQYMAFYSAYLGSGLATQGWVRFNIAAADTNPLGMEAAQLVAKPNTPDMTGLVEGIATILACKEAYAVQGTEIVPYLINPFTQRAIGLQADPSGTYAFVRALSRQSGQKGHVSIYFGEMTLGATVTDTDEDPLCGEIKLPIQVTDQSPLNAIGDASPERLQEIYYTLIHEIYFTYGRLELLGRRIAYKTSENPELSAQVCGLQVIDGEDSCEANTLPPSFAKYIWIDRANDWLNQQFEEFFIAARGQIELPITQEILDTGWGGAGIWYNRIAELNGALTTSVVNPPTIHKRPKVARDVVAAKQQMDNFVHDCDYFNPNLAGDKEIDLAMGDPDKYIAKTINESHKYWRCDRGGSASNFFWDTMIAVFGLNGLFNIRDTLVNGDGEEVTIHPLAQLSTIGKGLVDSSVTNLGMAMASSFGGGMLGILSQHLGAAGNAASSMFVSIATIGLSVGFILYYILPFLPFMYFFFALGGWVKGLFEAMIGTPLWALAHLRIDGDGLPGRSALNGYFLIFEIFLRPILTVFGLIGGLAIFGASATILNEVFNLAVYNVTGTELSSNGGEVFGRHIIDEFFFTVVYAIILYMMAVASFKMITLVPNNILRWIGQSVSSFNDGQEDPAAGLTQYAAMGGARIGGQLGQAATQGAGALGQAGQGLANAVNGPKTPPAGT